MKITITSPIFMINYDNTKKLICDTLAGMQTILPNHSNYITSINDGQIGIQNKNDEFEVFDVSDCILHIHNQEILIFANFVKKSQFALPVFIVQKSLKKEWSDTQNLLENNWSKLSKIESYIKNIND